MGGVMTRILTPFTVDAAIASGHDVFEVVLENWGEAFEDRYPTEDQTSFPATVAGVALGPLSTVDRVWLTWNAGRAFANNTPISPWYMTRCLTAEHPIMFSQQAGEGLSAINNTATYINEQRMYFTPFFIGAEPSGGTPGDVSRMYGTIVPNEGFTTDGYIDADGNIRAIPAPRTDSTDSNAFFPMLQLQFFLKRGLAAPSGKRAPATWKKRIAPTGAFGQRVACAYVPTYGRKYVSIAASADLAAANFVVGAVHGMNGWPSSNADWAPRETIEGDLTATNANETVRFKLCDPLADYIILYVVNQPGMNFVSYTIFTSD